MTCRAGFEAHLFEELAWAGASPRLLGPALLEAAKLPLPPPAFARMAFRVEGVAEGPLPEAAAPGVERLVRAGPPPVALQTWAPDVGEAAPLHGLARALHEGLEAALPAEPPRVEPEVARARGGTLVQVCLFAPGRAALGRAAARDALSLGAGGRRRMQRPGEAPSRAALKLEEALDGLGAEPGPGEVCVDLGAAPGGWTQRLVARGARVVAVDPARLLPALAESRRVTHAQVSAFDFEPEEPVDWLFCDMAWRPLEVAQLLGKWARRGWALHLVANIKLPMKDKNPILHRVRHTLESAGWRELRMRQLYHDRDEVTLTARCR